MTHGDENGQTTAIVVEEAEKLRGYLEMWKQTVAVQQHFNEIEWKIRGLALTTVTFTLGAASLTASSADKPPAIHIGTYDANSSAIILVIGLIIWLAFFFVDAGWYHKFLKASVKHGESLEDEIRNYLPEAGLAKRISEGSRTRLWPTKKVLHSSGKLKLFYLIIASMLAVLATILQFGAS